MDWKPLEPQARVLFYLQALSQSIFFWTPAILFGSAVLGGFTSSWVGLFTGNAALFLLLLFTLWMPALQHSRWGYVLREDDLMIRRGVLIQRVTAIPRCRVQHVDIKQGPLEQWFRLSRVRIHTASGLGGDGVIPGLNQESAEHLRDRLLESSHDDGV